MSMKVMASLLILMWFGLFSLVLLYPKQVTYSDILGLVFIASIVAVVIKTKTK